jgi:hypothetical protein
VAAGCASKQQWQAAVAGFTCTWQAGVAGTSAKHAWQIVTKDDISVRGWRTVSTVPSNHSHFLLVKLLSSNTFIIFFLKSKLL